MNRLAIKYDITGRRDATVTLPDAASPPTPIPVAIPRHAAMTAHICGAGSVREAIDIIISCITSPAHIIAMDDTVSHREPPFGKGVSSCADTPPERVAARAEIIAKAVNISAYVTMYPTAGWSRDFLFTEYPLSSNI